MTNTRLAARREHLHGTFHRDNPPVLTVESGAVVDFETLEVGWRTERVLPERELACIPSRGELDDGPALTGPVAVRQARPGQTLEVRMLELVTEDWGWTSAHLPEGSAGLFWDIQDGIATNQLGHRVEVTPFLGTVGIASRDRERRPGWWPHPRTGGNLDCNLLGAGSSLFLPVEVEGALLSVGDGHAAQGDGEVSGTAIECPMRSARLQLVLHDHLVQRPRALVNGRWVTFGLAESLDEAARMAVEEMVDLMQVEMALRRPEALALASSLVDLRVTQVVNPLKGIHAILKTSLINEGA
ncbi:MAG: acetamidase/formamidase family protein, partial [Candidatus Eremiobacteraeota bacterium]|nr:acetamidase/formamidase family protein [Candidatus Eremiobacteraeota bacterium]